MKRQTKFGIVLAAAAVISVSIASLVSARGWVQEGSEWRYVDNNNEYVTGTIQSSGNSKFYLNDDGYMARNYFLEDYNDNTYYFGANGAMVTNTWVAIDAANVSNQDDYVPDNYWFYFQASGKAMKAGSGSIKKTTIDGKKYAFNEYGQMCVGWVDATGKTINPDDDNPFENALYYAGGDNDGVLRSGWVTYYDGYDGDDSYATEYTNLYFYFNPSNNKKYGMDSQNQGKAETKKINGRTYTFDEKGIMVSGWDVYENRQNLAISSLVDKTTYFSGEDDGHQVKKGWVYAVPSGSIDSVAKDDDEEKYMYFNNSGDIVKDQFKKINGKYYAFNTNGIMKTGVVIWAPDHQEGSRYVNTLDLDYATGEELSKKGILRYDAGANDYYTVNSLGEVTITKGSVSAGDRVKLHFFGEDGARRTGSNNIEFSDDVFSLQTTSSGDKGTGIFSKKYYSLGILLKASSDIRYGIYTLSSDSMLSAQKDDDDKTAQEYKTKLEGNKEYVVLTTSGSKQKGNKTAKKDADGNYWMISKDTSALRGIWTQNIRESDTVKTFATKTFNINDLTTNYTNGNVYRTSELATDEDLGLFSDGYTDEIIASKSWKAVIPTNSTELHFECTSQYEGPMFQSDYNGGANKWIPFGMLDDAGYSATFNLTNATDDELQYFYSNLTNDYFLNCYWAN